MGHRRTTIARVILVSLSSNVWSGPWYRFYMKRGTVYLENGRRSLYSSIDV
jgi:hypothetical protein